MIFRLYWIDAVTTGASFTALWGCENELFGDYNHARLSAHTPLHLKIILTAILRARSKPRSPLFAWNRYEQAAAAAFVSAQSNPRASRQQAWSNPWVTSYAGRRQRVAGAAVSMVATDPGTTTAEIKQQQQQSGKGEGPPPPARVNVQPTRHDIGGWRESCGGPGETGTGNVLVVRCRRWR